MTKKIKFFFNLKFKCWSLKFNFFKILNFQKVRNFILYKKSFKWSFILKNKAFKLMSENVSKKTDEKKTEKKSGKKPQSKPYIVTHWHATLNSLYYSKAMIKSIVIPDIYYLWILLASNILEGRIGTQPHFWFET